MVIVPELALVVAALFAAMLVFAVATVAKGFAGLFPTDIPILSTIHRFFYNIALVGGAAASWIMADVIRPLINAVVGPVLAFVRMLEGLAGFAANMAQSWLWLLNTAIPRVISLVTSYALSAARSAEHFAARIVHALEVSVAATILRYYHAALAAVNRLEQAAAHSILRYYALAIAAVHHLAAALVHDIAVARDYAVSYARAGDQALGRAINSVEARLAAVTTGILATIRSEVATGVKAAEDFTVAETSKAIHLVDVEAAAAIDVVASGLIIDVGKLADVIGTDLPDIGAAVRSIPRVIPGDLAATLGLVGTLAVPMIRFMEQCGIPNCRNLSQYGRELRDLLGALEDGALIAFLVMLCTDPEAATSFIVDDIGGVIDDAVSAARDLMGVA